MKALVIAYKIENDKGSEDGTGYHIIASLAQKIPDLTVITRSNNIEKLQSDPNFQSVKLIGIDVPKWLGFFKNKGRGIILFYYLWQLCVGYKIHQLQKNDTYDVIHQLNFHTTWAPHFIFSKKSRIIWGPLTQHERVPFDCWYQSKLSYIAEIVKHGVKKLFWYCDPFLAWAARRSDVILLGHDVANYPYNRHRDKIDIVPQAGSVFDTGSEKEITDTFFVLFVGRFIDLKGTMLAIEAFKRANIPNAELTMIGTGPLEQNIAINTIPWLTQQDLAAYYTQASLFLFPSFEGQGLVVAEAMAHGCPVLCLADTGPATVAGDAAITVKKAKNQDIINTLALELVRLSEEYRGQPDTYRGRIKRAFDRAHELSWDEKTNRILEHYHGRATRIT